MVPFSHIQPIHNITVVIFAKHGCWACTKNLHMGCRHTVHTSSFFALNRIQNLFHHSSLPTTFCFLETMTDRSTAEEHTNFHPWPEERFCLTTGAYILLSTSFEHRILFRVLVIVDLILIFTMVALICLENVEHQARRTAKRAKLKAIISPEYLKQLREEHKKKGPMNRESLLMSCFVYQLQTGYCFSRGFDWKSSFGRVPSSWLRDPGPQQKIWRTQKNTREQHWRAWTTCSWPSTRAGDNIKRQSWAEDRWKMLKASKSTLLECDTWLLAHFILNNKPQASTCVLWSVCLCSLLAGLISILSDWFSEQ